MPVYFPNQLKQTLEWVRSVLMILFTETQSQSQLQKRSRTIYYSQAYPAEPTIGHRCPPMSRRAHCQLQRGSPVNSKPIIGAGWATGTELTQSDRREGLLHTSVNKEAEGPIANGRILLPPSGEAAARRMPWRANGKNTGL